MDNQEHQNHGKDSSCEELDKEDFGGDYFGLHEVKELKLLV